ncbi:unnamed protein product [Rotaria sp. Silwood1]|nr:unnamed protein product [Rotaria sp. Silwood1]CAF0936167.1 unnamed protein product [Rotaria sp. Silwood1]CAF3429409.1 unnamed protein product [Rotaria sp. Silwood1]CAF4508344.1 unnamed protein product [Rotaria sp. Silwood1]
MENSSNLHDLDLDNKQGSNVTLPSTSAEDYGNDPTLEQQWAMKAFQHAETYFNLLCAVDPKQLRLSRHDDQIYSRFRELFPDFKIDVLDENKIKSNEGKQLWRPFCEEFRDLIDEYNYGTLVRTDSKGEYTNENTFLVVRIQFYAIEIARNREGYNDSIRHLYGSKKFIRMTKWDNLHERYFNYLAILSFDKAKELLEKDGNKMNSDFLQYFIMLVQYERTYHNFGFVVGPKGNLSIIRKDKSLLQCYSDLHMSLIELQSNSKQNNTTQSMTDDTKETNYIQQLTAGLITFLNVRTNLMKLYEQISSAVKRNEHNVRLENYIDEITHISQIDMSPLNISVLSPILQLLKHETDCLLLLIQSYVFIADYQYMNGISTLHNMHCVLKEWNDNIENQQNTNHRFILSSTSPLNFFKSPTKPALYTFYSKFHELLVAKFTFYFNDILYEYGGVEAKTPMGKTNPEFTARIAQFYRRSNVEWITLILHKTKQPIYSSQIDQLADYHLIQPVTSFNDNKPYQIIFGYPHKPNSTDEIAQQMITKALINHEMLTSGEKIFYSGDTNQTKTYFLQNIDPRITLTLVFASHRQERDTTIINFLNELLDLLRGSRLLLYFKNAAK